MECSSDNEDFADAVEIQPAMDDIPEYVTSATLVETESQTDSSVSRADAHTQMDFTTYPRLMDDAGRIEVELRKIQREVSVFISRMDTIRHHGEARTEIAVFTNKMKSFVSFHRGEIQTYLQAVVTEGHKTAVRKELRDSSNECLMPILNVLDNIRTLNLELGASRGPLRGYRQSLRALEEIRGHLELIRFIEPPTLLI